MFLFADVSPLGFERANAQHWLLSTFGGHAFEINQCPVRSMLLCLQLLPHLAPATALDFWKRVGAKHRANIPKMKISKNKNPLCPNVDKVLISRKRKIKLLTPRGSIRDQFFQGSRFQ